MITYDVKVIQLEKKNTQMSIKNIFYSHKVYTVENIM